MIKERRSLVRRLEKRRIETVSLGINSVSEILEICCHTKVAVADKLNDCLQIVFLLSGYSNLSILQLALHLETL